MRRFIGTLIAAALLVTFAWTSFAQGPQIQPSSPATLLAAPVRPANPDAVLWDQPLSTVNQNAYVDQEFTDYPEYSSYLADDFVNQEPWDIDTFFVPGNGWNGFSSLFNADSLTWQIYADNGGVPAGDPSGGGAFWSLTLAPTDPAVMITDGTGGYPSDSTLDLEVTPVHVPAGHWWLVFYPTMSLSGGGQFGRQPSDTTNGYWGQFINPGGGFGYGTEWQSWAAIGAAQQDIAFRLEANICCCPSITCGTISYTARLDPYGRRMIKWKVPVVFDWNGPVGDVAVTAELTSPVGGPWTRTRTSHLANGIASFSWGASASGVWSIDVSDMVLGCYNFVDGDQCHAEIAY